MYFPNNLLGKISLKLKYHGSRSLKMFNCECVSMDYAIIGSAINVVNYYFGKVIFKFY